MNNMPNNIAQINYQFNAQNYEPDTGSTVDQVPDGQYAVIVTKTELKETRDKDGFYFVIEETITEGMYKDKKLAHRFNLFNTNPQAVDIAHRQLAAVSYVTGVFNLSINGQAQGAALMGARFQVKVVNKDSGYGLQPEIKAVFDIHGNKPNKAGSGPAAHAPQQQAPAQQPAWGGQQAAPVQQSPWGGNPQQ